MYLFGLQNHARLLINHTLLATNLSLRGPDGIIQLHPLIAPLCPRGSDRHMALVCVALTSFSRVAMSFILSILGLPEDVLPLVSYD